MAFDRWMRRFGWRIVLVAVTATVLLRAWQAWQALPPQ